DLSLEQIREKIKGQIEEKVEEIDLGQLFLNEAVDKILGKAPLDGAFYRALDEEKKIKKDLKDKVEKLEKERNVLKDHVEATEGNGKLQELLAQIEVKK
ncbi:4620_t:CDS:1, partial [Cetraspora pellucida]